MNELDVRDERLIRLLRRAQPMTLPAEVRERALRAARAEWSKEESEPGAFFVPWWEAWRPVLGAAAAVALLIAGVQWMNDALRQRWDARPVAAAPVAAGRPGLEQLVGHAGPGADELAAAWETHRRQLREMLTPPTRRDGEAAPVPTSEFRRGNREAWV